MKTAPFPLSYRVHLSPVSANVKTGPIPVSTTSAETCATVCPFRTDADGGCYAASGPLAMHWRAVTNGSRGTDWKSFVETIANLPIGRLWRHNQAGDLPGDGARIDAGALSALVRANVGRRGFTYTHYSADADNCGAIRNANDAGFTVNLSANNVAHADTLADTGAGPVVSVLPLEYARGSKRGEWAESAEEYRARLATLPMRTPAGRRIVVCPATNRDDVSCATCALCAVAGRTTIVGFPAHGTGAKRASAVASRIISIKIAA